MAKIDNEAICATCSFNLTKKYGWRPGSNVIHCMGAPDVFLVVNRILHHGKKKWKCPRCQRHLGCDTCAGKIANGVLCVPCQTFADGDVVFGSGLEPIDVPNVKPGVKQFEVGIDRALPAEDRD